MALPAIVRRQASGPIQPASVLMMERHFTVSELSEMWGFSGNFINGRFRDEPGVMHTQKKSSKGKRAYGALRIPQSVAERVYSGMVNR
jgi:hypothetical protein